MRVAVIGKGYLGTTHAACMSQIGHNVLGVDIDAEKVVKLQSGEVPFFEPDLESLLRENLASGRLRFTTSYEEAAEFADVHFLGGTAGRSYGRHGRRGQCCCWQIWVTPQGGGAPTGGWIPGRTGSLITPGISGARGRIPDERTCAARIPAGDRIPADQRTRTGQRVTGTERIKYLGPVNPAAPGEVT
jgi:UDP-glucose/GDP-mannose dehydrogenase family, NAD binding domain